MDLLTVYNICGIDCVEKVDWYKKCVHQLLKQNFHNHRVVISSCRNSEDTILQLQKEFGDSISYNFITDLVPVNVSFNHSVIKSVEKFGEFCGYLYIDSGIILQDTNIISSLYNLFQSGPYGIASMLPNEDIGFHYEHMPEFYQHYIVPLGKAINNHFQIFSNTLLSYNERILPDIFAGHCTESVFTFMCAALKLKWIVHNDTIRVQHIKNIDKQSAGFDTHKWTYQTNRPTWDHPFKISSIINRIKTETNMLYGLGYEECRNVMIHNPNQFDNEGYCTNNILKDIVKTTLFLQEEEFDYKQITHTFI